MLACGGSRRTGGGRDFVRNGRGRNSRCRSGEDCGWHYLRGRFPSARFPAMPENAVESGFVDFVLSPEKIGIELARIARHPGVRTGWLRQRRKRRLRKAGRCKPGFYGCSAPASAWILRITRSPRCTGESHTAWYCAAFTTRRITCACWRRSRRKWTRFFAMHLFMSRAFFATPQCFRPCRRGCCRRSSTQAARRADSLLGARMLDGRGAYSLAICLLEVLPSDAERPRIQSTRPTSAKRPSQGRARECIRIDQPRGIGRTTPALLLAVPRRPSVTKALREACIFARQNVASDPPFARIDLISCRNLLIYFDVVLQKKVLPTLHYALNPGGYLVLGLSEGPIPSTISSKRWTRRKNLCEGKHAAAGSDRSTVSAPAAPSTEAMRQRRSRRIRQTCASPATGSCSGA